MTDGPARTNQPDPFCDTRTVWQGSGTVEENVLLADRTWRLSVLIDDSDRPFPAWSAGQFVMLRLKRGTDPLLGRPLAIYRTTKLPHQTRLEVVYLVVGKMTGQLARIQTGEPLDLWAPLGRGFVCSPKEHVIMVAGGIGQTPFLQLAATLPRRTLLYGARSADRIACIDDFRTLGVPVQLATDDGSVGYRGPVTHLIREVYQEGEPTKVLCCGPQPMLKAAFHIAQELGLPCEVSLETPMSCGLGICFGCVVPVLVDPDHSPGLFDYKRTCIDGPAFDAYRLVWS